MPTGPIEVCPLAAPPCRLRSGRRTSARRPAAQSKAAAGRGIAPAASARYLLIFSFSKQQISF
eukprot:8812648-Pyramimonas_sp.AAC.1